MISALGSRGEGRTRLGFPPSLFPLTLLPKTWHFMFPPDSFAMRLARSAMDKGLRMLGGEFTMSLQRLAPAFRAIAVSMEAEAVEGKEGE